MSTHKSDVLRNLFALELNAKLTVKYKKIFHLLKKLQLISESLPITS